ncbi:MAG: hypothetical protein AAGG02_10220 [Cyanobacteria bacterium P01_H01_bin.15]
MKTLVILGLVWLLLAPSFLAPQPAQAATCRTNSDHEICILSIKRSAKNYWEYRARVTIDGKKEPKQIYNCREKRRYFPSAPSRPFAINGAGQLICQFFKK